MTQDSRISRNEVPRSRRFRRRIRSGHAMDMKACRGQPDHGGRNEGAGSGRYERRDRRREDDGGGAFGLGPTKANMGTST